MAPYEVEKIGFSKNTIWIDKAKLKGFSGVSSEVWDFKIGVYRVCEKWLKDRSFKSDKRKPSYGGALTDDDIRIFQTIVAAISETIRIMAEIDEVIDQHGGLPGAFVTESEDLPKAAEDAEGYDT